MSRCRCCDKKLSEVELMSSTYVTDENGNEIKINEPDDFCFNCRVESSSKNNYTEREYQFEDLSSGLTPSYGFSDNY